MGKKRWFILLLTIVCASCASSMQISGVTKYSNYHAPRKIALLPTTSEKKFAAERMDKINTAVLESAAKEGYTVVGEDQVKKFLRGSYAALLKDPENRKLLRKIARKFKIDSFMYCEINEWQADVPVKGKEDSFLNKVSLTYTAVNAKTLKPVSKNSGSSENVGPLNEESVINDLAKELAAKLMKSL